MKHMMKKLLLLTMIISISAGSFSAPAVQAAAKKRSLKKWYSTCLTLGKKLHKKKFTYEGSAAAPTYKDAIKKSIPNKERDYKKCNCALYVSWCLQEFGITNPGDRFYVMSGGIIQKNFSSWDKKKVKIIKVNKKCKNAKLKPGDVVCWKTPGIHVNIYAGKDAYGGRMWYDGGKVATKENATGSKYAKFNVQQLSYFEDRKISYIIRIKGLK